MAEKIQLRRSAVSGRVPTTSQLDLGEIGINTHDGKLYIKKDNGSASIVQVGDTTDLETDIDNQPATVSTTYLYNTSTAGNVASASTVHLNSSNWANATIIYASVLNSKGKRVDAQAQEYLKPGAELILQDMSGTGSSHLRARVSGASFNSTTMVIGINNVSANGSTPSSLANVTLGVITSTNAYTIEQALGFDVEDATGVGAFTTTELTDNATLKSTLETLGSKAKILREGLGVAVGDTDLGTFTGTTISDNTTVKAALQELETALEGHIPVLVEVHNETGGDLTKGDVVYVNGTHASGKPTVALADANGSGTYPALGLIYATVADGVTGLVIISGFLDGIDTDTPAWDAGDALYVSETAGEMTATRPTASGTKVQKVAMTSRRHQSAGSVIVIGAGRTNDVPNELTALTGVALNAANLGTFTGATISDNTTVKTALQELETAHESLPRMLHASWDASTAGSFDDANDVIASRGIASVVRSAEGIFRVTFTTAFADANYTVTCGVGSTDYSGTGASPRAVSILERNAAYVDVICEISDDAENEDNAYMSLVVML